MMKHPGGRPAKHANPTRIMRVRATQDEADKLSQIDTRDRVSRLLDTLPVGEITPTPQQAAFIGAAYDESAALVLPDGRKFALVKL